MPPLPASQFTVRYARDKEELDACYTLMQQTAFKSDELFREKVVGAWEDMLTKGVGDVIITENPHYTTGFHGAGSHIFSCMFGCFVSESYVYELAKRVEQNNVYNLANDFLKRYIASMSKDAKVERPRLTVRQIEQGQEESSTTGIHFLSYMAFVHPSLQPGPWMDDDWDNLASSVRNFTVRAYGGFRFHTWFNFTIGDYVTDGYVGAGQQIVSSYAGNEKLQDSDRRYLLCRTRNSEISKKFGLDGKETERKQGNWYSSLFVCQPKAKLTRPQKVAGALIAHGYSHLEIAKYMYRREWDEGILPETLTQRVRRNQTRLTNNLEKEYNLGDRSQAALQSVLLAHMDEVRPVVMVMYPDQRRK